MDNYGRIGLCEADNSNRKTTMDGCGQSAAHSKTAGCKFDSCRSRLEIEPNQRQFKLWEAATRRWAHVKKQIHSGNLRLPLFSSQRKQTVFDGDRDRGCPRINIQL
jgi:hypothetical protein